VSGGRPIRRTLPILAATLLLAGCFSLSQQDQYRLEALKWAKQAGGKDVTVKATREVEAGKVRMRCPVPVDVLLPQKVGAVELRGRFPQGNGAFVLVAPGQGAYYAVVPAPSSPCA
jgi:hypothetical protein